MNLISDLVYFWTRPFSKDWELWRKALFLGFVGLNFGSSYAQNGWAGIVGSALVFTVILPAFVGWVRRRK